jgi:drug/metabolite transporter (DMT)-like permease
LSSAHGKTLQKSPSDDEYWFNSLFARTRVATAALTRFRPVGSITLMLAAFLTTVLFSISAVCGNRTAKMLGGTEANFWRLCFAAMLLAAWAHGMGTGLAGAALPIFLLSGCVGFGIGDMALFQALPRLGSRLSVMLVLCLSSPLAALMEWVWLGTRLSLPEVTAGLVILGGVALALAPEDSRSRPRAGRRLWAGLSFGFVAALCQALGAVMSRKAFAVAAAAGERIDGITAAYQRILGGVALGAIFLLLVKRDSILEAFLGGPRTNDAASPGRPWGKAWPWVLANGVAGPALGVSCYQWALQTTPTGVVLPIVAITPLVIIPFSYHLEGERPTLRSLAGGLAAVAGAVGLAWVTTRRLA